MVTRLLLIAAGGALGAVARYGVGVWAVRLFPATQWPWGTLAVNIVGGLLMGLLAGWLAFRGGLHGESIRLFAALFVGLMVARRAFGAAL